MAKQPNKVMKQGAASTLPTAGTDPQFDAHRVKQYVSPIKPTPRKPAKIAKPAADENPTFGSSKSTDKVNFGPGSSGSLSKAKGADRQTGPVWERQL
jgi:hypothetical protein